MIKALLRFIFQVFNFFCLHRFLHLWLQSMLERQVLRLLVDPCYTADDRPYDSRQGNRGCNSDYDVNHYVVVVAVVVICRTKTKITTPPSVIFKIKTNHCFKSKIVNGISKP